MPTYKYLSDGARAVLRFRKLAVLFYIANLIAAAVIVIPAAAVIGGRIGRSMESDRLFPNFDPSWVTEMIYEYQGAPFTAIALVGGAMAVLFLILNTYLAGGALAVFHRENDTFFGACARYFPRLFRLMLISLFVYGLVMGIGAGLNAIIGNFQQDSMSAKPWTILRWVRLLFLFFLFGTANMIFDYAKIICVVENRRSAFKSTLAAFSFSSRNLGGTLKIYWSCTIFALLLLLAYHGLSEVIGQGSLAAVLLMFVLRQVYMFFRMGTRLWTWASELRYYAGWPVEVLPEVPPVAPPVEIEADSVDHTEVEDRIASISERAGEVPGATL